MSHSHTSEQLFPPHLITYVYCKPTARCAVEQPHNHSRRRYLYCRQSLKNTAETLLAGGKLARFDCLLWVSAPVHQLICHVTTRVICTWWRMFSLPYMSPSRVIIAMVSCWPLVPAALFIPPTMHWRRTSCRMCTAFQRQERSGHQSQVIRMRTYLTSDFHELHILTWWISYLFLFLTHWRQIVLCHINKIE